MGIAWREGATLEKCKKDKLLVSINHYYSCMMSNCTPFGLFVSCAALRWSVGLPIPFPSQEKEIERQTQLDMHFLCALISVGTKPKLTYFPSTNLYLIDDEI